ncbi:ATP-binding protein [Myxococcus qinghaiensis]|uniref:ATP-binding protein n=1 Tax=Myxococcus qinghaiensis TaxID=2906758 RepID=UPI0020A72253|nr:ATP-binding protein [Myxococcus qinghaiensis]MCP3163326.1 putative DNA binding domain-containing protein [Myxococcus qinghaiensis]
MEIRDITDEEAQAILGYEEGHFRDVKAREVQPAKLSMSISAFANTAGGELFIGISETRNDEEKTTSWRGFTDQEAANGFLAMIEGLGGPDLCQPRFLSCKGRDGYVLHLVVQKTRQIVKATNGTPYVRRGAQKLPVVGEDALRRLALDKGIATYEDETVRAPLDEVTNSVTVLEFLLSEVPTAEPDRWLRSQFLIHADNPTVAATLLFADEPQAILPKRSAVKIFRYKTVDEDLNRDSLAFDPLTIEGPIYDLIKKAVSETKDIVEGIKKLGAGRLEAVSYPNETLHEIITNAVLHRDYSIATDIQIRIYDDRIEVHSPGRLPGHVTVGNMLEEQFARNPKLVRLINKFPNPPNKDVGEGLNTAFQAMRKIRLQEPEVIEKDQSVVVYIRHTRLSTPAQIVMEYVEKNPFITNQLGREITGLRRDVEMKDVFVALRKQGLLEQVPGKRGRATSWRKAQAPAPTTK